MVQDSTSQREAEVDARLLDFVRTKVDSFVKWDLVRFFHDNPYAVDKAENIARFTGRDQRKVEQELQELAERGVVEASSAGVAGAGSAGDAGETSIYRYVKDPDTRAMIEQFVHACDDREFRIRAINLVIEGLQ